MTLCTICGSDNLFPEPTYAPLFDLEPETELLCPDCHRWADYHLTARTQALETVKL